MRYIPIFVLILVITAQAFHYHAASASQSDVNDAYVACANGDSLMITGNATWTTQQVVSKKIKIFGTACTLTADGYFGDGMIRVSGIRVDTTTRISGIVFRVASQSASFNTTYAGVVVRALVGCNGTKIRVDHCTFIGFNIGLSICAMYGIVDNNTFRDCNRGLMQVTERFTSCACGDSSWISLSAGSDSSLFVEGNWFGCSTAYPSTTTANEMIGSAGSGKMVIRYNTFDFRLMPTKTWPIDNMPIGLHGNYGNYWESGDGNSLRGPSVVEIYENTVYCDGIHMGQFVNSRGGAYLIHDNDIIGTVSADGVSIMYCDEEYYSAGAFPGGLRTSWPAEDQVQNSFTWNNTYRGQDFNDGDLASVEIHSSNTSAQLQEGRDYHLHAPQATGGYEYYTGANGASNTNPTDGDPYTSQGTLNWSETGANKYYGYVPAAYPHKGQNDFEPTRKYSTMKAIR